MAQDPVTFVIPTYRLRDLSEAVRAYDENFRRNGHSLPLMVFDDSTLANHDKYFPLLEQTETANELVYVGPHQKEQFLGFLRHHLRDRKLDSLIRNLFRPSYGGNRNFTLIYTLGQIMVSADDDMRPEAIIENSPGSLAANEVSRGKLIRPGDEGHTPKVFDLLIVFKEVLGKRAADVPSNYARGEHLLDSAMDLETNSSKGYSRENSLTLQPGSVPPGAIVKVAQTYRTGTDGIDALDFAHIFLANDDQQTPDELTDLYMMVNFRPVVTNKNWRFDCGVAGYDNRLGLPPFFPTRPRFEDYIYRLWIQQKGIVAAHVDAAQRHIRNNYMRNPLAAEIFNAEISNLLKRKLKASVQRMDALTVTFGYDGAVTHADTEKTLDKIRAVSDQAVRVATKTKDPCAGSRSKSLPRTWRSPFTASSRISFSKMSRASSMTSSIRFTHRSSSGRASSRFATTIRIVGSSPRFASATGATGIPDPTLRTSCQATSPGPYSPLGRSRPLD